MQIYKNKATIPYLAPLLLFIITLNFLFVKPILYIIILII